MKVNFGQWRSHSGILVTVVLSITSFQSGLNYSASAKPISVADESAHLAQESEANFVCPNNVEQLAPLLLKDLPAYSNRVIQRTQDINQAAGIENYIIIASKAEFEPLNLPRLQYDQIDEQDPEQVFFTVLERQYIDNKIVTIETYHWLFLTKTVGGWRIVMMFSRFGESNKSLPPAPPKETTDGIIGQGVQLWLRDCRAGTVRS